MTDAKLMAFVERIENVESEQRDRGADKRSIYDEVKDAGYNAKALRKLVAERRQKDREEIAEAMDGYRIALGMAVEAVRDGMSLDDATQTYGFSRSAIHRASHCEEISACGTAREMVADDLGEYVPPRIKAAKPVEDFGATMRAMIEKAGLTAVVRDLEAKYTPDTRTPDEIMGEHPEFLRRTA